MFDLKIGPQLDVGVGRFSAWYLDATVVSLAFHPVHDDMNRCYSVWRGEGRIIVEERCSPSQVTHHNEGADGKAIRPSRFASVHYDSRACLR